ncbi:hypothetical protein WME97_37730 [Sorangium sp. So ce367]|uniref:hypothetical protein n=1 Tax=Sorangium sp. So ce367 TaxID=3133305 RepID=UPI003F5FB908
MIAPDVGVAAWAAENIDLGLGLGHVEPLVLGPAVVPEITDPAEAEKDAELAVLSAVAHGNGPNGLTVLLRLLARAGIALTANESARIHACADIAILDRWIDNVLGAKTATDVLS